MRLKWGFGLKLILEGEMGTAESDSFLRAHHDALRKSIWGKYAMHQDSSESTSMQGAKLLVEFLVMMCKVNLMTVEDLRR